MRLIDADALMKEFAEYVRASNNSDFARCPTWNDAVSLLGSAPTIEERKTGQWIPCSEPPKKDGTYIVYAPDYMGGSSSAKECHNGVMFSKYKNGKWSIEHGYYSRPNCVRAWMPLPEPWEGEEHG